MSDSTPDSGRYDLGLLFTDGLPEMDASAGYRGAVAARAAGITYRQLDYWARTGLVEPTVRGASGSGTQRLYGFRDILVLKLVKRLLDTGISLQQIRTAVNQLRESGVVDLAQTTLMSDGASFYHCASNDEVIDLVSRGRGRTTAPARPQDEPRPRAERMRLPRTTSSCVAISRASSAACARLDASRRRDTGTRADSMRLSSRSAAWRKPRR